ncbi:FAD-dependent oxidoreductase [Amycolatopsis sp. NPDC059090]|uniref:FAD-dependent oxidoreductase n=1 Tax=Amycolatopsis sp. NPDC059090 TaxID=3346723 RepID=UPI00366C9A20
MSSRDPWPGHAVVIGCSVSGLLAAWALANHFRRVTVFERDDLPAEPGFRPGTPQSRHAHVLLARGAQSMERMFPGLSEELVSAGAIATEWPADTLTLTDYGWSPRFIGGVQSVSLTHQLLEWKLRQRLSALAGIDFLGGFNCTGLLASRNFEKVTGVVLRPRAGAGPEVNLTADLVVDASGRGSRAAGWLRDIGHEPPREARIESSLGYASRFYAPPAGFDADWKAIYLGRKHPENLRSGILVPVERGRWLVTLTGRDDAVPSTDEAAFLDFARRLRSPVLYDALREAEPLTPVWGFRRTQNVRRHYEAMRRRPEGFIVVGDAACAFNPLYGQGTTVAALGAETLDSCLREQRRHTPAGDLAGFSSLFQRRLAITSMPAWRVATSGDLKRQGTGSAGGVVKRLQRRYLEAVFAVALENREVSLATLRVLHMLSPPTSLLQPAVTARVLRGLRRSTPPAGPVPPPPRRHLAQVD